MSYLRISFKKINMITNLQANDLECGFVCKYETVDREVRQSD